MGTHMFLCSLLSSFRNTSLVRSGLHPRPTIDDSQPCAVFSTFFARRGRSLHETDPPRGGSPLAGPLFARHGRAGPPGGGDLPPGGYPRLSYRQADTLWKQYTPDWDLHQLRHTAISVRAAHDYTEVDLKRFSGHTSLRSLERYIADNREAAKRKAREWERRHR